MRALLVVAAAGCSLAQPTLLDAAGPVSCSNGIVDGDETDVDCGGHCGACSDRQACQAASDCTSGACCGGICQPWLAGYASRRRVAIENLGSDALTDFQVKITVDTETPIGRGELRADGADLRVTLADGETQVPFAVDGLDTASTDMYARLPAIPPGTSTVYVYAGDPAATPVASTRDTFIDGVLTNASFEDPGGWDMPVPDNGTVGGFSWPDCLGDYPASDGRCVVSFEVQDPGNDGMNGSTANLVQTFTIPDGEVYRVVADFTVHDCASCSASLGVDDVQVWAFTPATDVPVTGHHQDVDPLLAIRSGSHRLVLSASLGSQGIITGYFDNVRLRRYADPDPVTVSGEEQRACH